VDYLSFVEHLIRPLLMHPDCLQVKQLPSGDGALFIQALVAPDDLGRVIGKQGRTASALRNLVIMAAAKDGNRMKVNFDAI